MKNKNTIILIIVAMVVIFLVVGIGYFGSSERRATIVQDEHDHEAVNHDEPDHSEHDHDDHAHDDHDQQKSSKVTVWGDRFEIFMEHPFVLANTPTEFVTHITDRAMLQPWRKGSVTFVLMDESNISTRHVERSPARDGIYIPKLTFPQSGRWSVSLVIPVEGNEHVVELPALKVYNSQDEVDRAPTPEEVAGISFLKEQQWKIPFETKGVHQKNIRSQAVLAVSASAIVDEDGKPVAFVQLAGETFKKRYLKLGQKEHGFIQVLSGLSEGEYVVTQGAYAVAEAEHHKDHDDHDHEGHGDDSIVRISEEDMKRFGIEVDKAGAGAFDQHIRVPGEIVINSDLLAHIVPRVSGVVQQVRKNLGDFVKKGEIMAVIGSRELADAKAAYLTSIERFHLAEPLLEREEKLWKKKISPEQDFLDAKKNLAEAKIEMQSAKHKLYALGLTMKDIKEIPSESAELLTAFDITAPFNGTIIEKHMTHGEVVREDDDIFVIANLDTVWVDLRVPQKDVCSIKKGQEVTISGNANATEAEGIIDYVHPLIDEKTRTKLVRVVLDNTSGLFQPGTFVTADVLVEKCNAKVVVAKSVIQDVDGKSCVFVHNGQGFLPRPVTIGRSNTGHVEITAGLETGEIIVTQNSFRIKAQLEKAAGGEQAGHGHSH
jgi:cobalt-zinc-cadmium efflux system membrane fusion protein